MRHRARRGLAEPRPTAWAYLPCPIYYRHAAPQWQRRIEGFAAREGFTVERWWVDHEAPARSIDLNVMLEFLPKSPDVKALFLPYPTALRAAFPNFTQAREIAAQLGMQVFILDRVMTINPEAMPDLGEEPRSRFRLPWRGRVATP